MGIKSSRENYQVWTEFFNSRCDLANECCPHRTGCYFLSEWNIENTFMRRGVSTPSWKYAFCLLATKSQSEGFIFRVFVFESIDVSTSSVYRHIQISWIICRTEYIL